MLALYNMCSTLPKTNISPENEAVQKEEIVYQSTINVQGLLLKSYGH